MNGEWKIPFPPKIVLEASGFRQMPTSSRQFLPTICRQPADNADLKSANRRQGRLDVGKGQQLYDVVTSIASISAWPLAIKYLTIKLLISIDLFTEIAAVVISC